MFHNHFTSAGNTSELLSQFFDPTVIAALIASFVALFSVYLNLRSINMQRLESERKEIYKKLNSFYGPMRLHLKNSNELYGIFSSSVKNRLNIQSGFRTLPYILSGNTFSKTENELFNQIIEIGKKMEAIITENAGLIDDDNLHLEMIELSTHIRIIRLAYEGKFDQGEGKGELFEGKTFPNRITQRIDDTFFELKNRLNKLNKKKLKKRKLSK